MTMAGARARFGALSIWAGRIARRYLLLALLIVGVVLLLEFMPSVHKDSQPPQGFAVLAVPTGLPTSA